MTDIKKKQEKLNKIATEFRQLMDDGKKMEALEKLKKSLILSNEILEDCNHILRGILGEPKKKEPTEEKILNVHIPESKYMQ